MTTTPHTPAPYCSACGYELSGAIDSSRCPECGRPLVEVLVRDEGAQRSRRRYESEQTLLGLPLVSIAMGPGPDGKPGHAKGWLAMGDKATGVVAIGGRAIGVVAIGGVAIGVFAGGGVSCGLVIAGGGVAVALGLAMGGVALGSFAVGGMAIGYMAFGGVAIAAHGVGGMVVGGRGLPINVNFRQLTVITVMLSLGVGVVAAIPGIVGSVLMRRGGRRDRE